MFTKTDKTAEVNVSQISKYYFDSKKSTLNNYLLRDIDHTDHSPNSSIRNINYVLKDISFCLKKGMALGIVGTNGSGKSTLLQIISGVLKPSLGELNIRGKIACILELGSGFNLEFTGRENIYINALCFGLSSKEVDLIFRKVVDFADIGDYIDKPLRIYSSGMIARLAFAVLANVKADILVIDEALSVGDSRFSLKCIRFIKEFKKTGIVILVSHDMSSISTVCDRCLWIEDGRQMFIGSTKSAIQQYNAFLFGNGTASVESHETIEMDEPNPIKINVESQKIKVFEFKFTNVKDGAKVSELRNINNSKIQFQINSEITINNAIVGFMISNRHGIEITTFNSDQINTSSPLHIIRGTTNNISFEFELPSLVEGDYSISIGLIEIVEGKQQTHLFIQDCCFFTSKSGFHNGIFQLRDVKFKNEVNNA